MTNDPFRKVYLAARYSRYPEMQGYAQQLEAKGYHITSRWITGIHAMDGDGVSPEAALSLRIQAAREDLADLREAGIVICFTEEPRVSNSRGGRHVEYGYALAFNKAMIFTVGPEESIFYSLPECHRKDTFEEVLNIL